MTATAIKENTNKKTERPNESWWWVRRWECVPEIALYGNFKEGSGFKLVLEDDKLYQESDFVAIYGQAINPAILDIYEKIIFDIYEKIKNSDYNPELLTRKEMTVMKLYQCRNCVVEGCGPGHSWQCFKNAMRDIVK